MDDDLPLAYNISFDTWVIDFSSTSPSTINVSCNPSSHLIALRAAAAADDCLPDESSSSGCSRPLLARCWKCIRKSLRRCWNSCKQCRSSKSIHTQDRPPRSDGRSSRIYYSQMSCQDRDEKLKEAILYCKKTMGRDAASSPCDFLTPRE